MPKPNTSLSAPPLGFPTPSKDPSFALRRRFLRPSLVVIAALALAGGIATGAKASPTHSQQATHAPVAP